MTELSHLPPELLELLISYLDGPSTLHLGSTCSLLHQLTSQPRVWHRLMARTRVVVVHREVEMMAGGDPLATFFLCHWLRSVRIPTDIGDSSRYTLPLPAFRLRTDDFSSMHTTPRKMCPRHQKICCKNPFPKMLSFFGFGTRRHFTVGCFIDIFGAKTTQKHCSF